MSTTSTRVVTLGNSGDVGSTNTLNSATNGAAPGSITIHTLAPGDNTITVPTGGSTVRGATIDPPDGNTNQITLKGIGADTGIPIAKIDPTSIGFETAPANFVLNAASTIAGLRIHWS